MRVVVVGAGAIGAGVGGLLAATGTEVVLVARGAHARVMQTEGLRLRTPEREHRVQVPVVEHWSRSSGGPGIARWSP